MGDVVLVTGGSGFLGQHIVKLLQERASDVREIRVFDKIPYQNKLGNALPITCLAMVPQNQKVN